VNDILVAVKPVANNFSPERWAERLGAALPGRRIGVRPRTNDLAGYAYAAVWKPEPGLLSSMPDLKVIFNLGAGVDALLADETLPAVPLVRVATADLTNRMSEYVVMHTLMIHRRQRLLDDCQRGGVWWTKDQWAAKDTRVGILGMGVLGEDAARKLALLGFDVAGWSRRPKSVPGIATFAGASGLAPFLARTDILVALTPLTADTRGILNRALFAGLARDGRLGAPFVVNAGRGGLQVEADILAALDDGTLGGAVLDVFEEEPLAPGHRFWTHPKVTVTPHNAADSDPDAITDYVAAQIRAFEAGGALTNVVDRTLGY